MGHLRLGFRVVIVLALSTPAWSAPPLVNGSSPFGAQKGVATEVAINGGNLAGSPQWIAPFALTTVPPTAPNGNEASWKSTITISPETAIGVYPIRVQTSDGISNPFLFAVGQVPQVAEKEENSTFETAQPIPSLVVVEGQAAGSDVDFFRFAGKKGQRIVIDAQCARIGSGIDPTIRLTTVGHAFVASADDSPGLLTDARLTAVLPVDGDYVVELSDSRYQGSGRPIYRLLIGPLPMADEVYPIGGRQGETIGLELRGGTLTGVRATTATLSPAPDSNVFRPRVTTQSLGMAVPGEPVLDLESLAPLVVSRLPELREPADPAAPALHAAAPVVLNGRIDPAGDEDRFALAVTPGQRLRIEVDAAEVGSALDGILQLLGVNGAVLAVADDTPIPAQGKKGKGAGIVSPDPSIDFTVPAGLTELTLALRDLESRGGIGFPYRITITPISPTFEIALNEPQVSVPKGGTAVVGVAVSRQEYNGPITLGVANLPPGLSVRPGTIADGQLVGSFSLTAAADASFGVVNLNVAGQGGPIAASALKHLVFAQQATLPTNTLTQHGLACAPGLPPVVKLDSPAAPIEIVHGYGASIPVKSVRSAGADAALAVTPLPLPPGLSVPPVNIAEKAPEGNVAINAAPETALGTMTIALVAKGKIANLDQTFAIPAVTLNVVRPAALELTAPGIEINAGATVEVKGKVIRKGPFKEPVTVKLDGLPAGLKADPVALAPAASDFTIKLIADPKAAPATASANLALAFQVNKKDYPTPPTPLAVKVLPPK